MLLLDQLNACGIKLQKYSKASSCDMSILHACSDRKPSVCFERSLLCSRMAIAAAPSGSLSSRSALCSEQRQLICLQRGMKTKQMLILLPFLPCEALPITCMLRVKCYHGKSIVDIYGCRREEERVARLEAAKLYVEADWIRESEAAADGYTSEDEAEQSDQYECVACDKIFKSEKALTNHTRWAQHPQHSVHALIFHQACVAVSS